jgi:hypothetical protein
LAWGGAEAHLQLVKRIFLAFGYKRTLLLNSTPSYAIEEGVKLEGKFKEAPEEFYFGLSVKLADLE